jgi:hypothetical protein
MFECGSEPISLSPTWRSRLQLGCVVLCVEVSPRQCIIHGPFSWSNSTAEPAHAAAQAAVTSIIVLGIIAPLSVAALAALAAARDTFLCACRRRRRSALPHETDSEGTAERDQPDPSFLLLIDLDQSCPAREAGPGAGQQRLGGLEAELDQGSAGAGAGALQAAALTRSTEPAPDRPSS